MSTPSKAVISDDDLAILEGRKPVSLEVDSSKSVSLPPSPLMKSESFICNSPVVTVTITNCCKGTVGGGGFLSCFSGGGGTPIQLNCLIRDSSGKSWQTYKRISDFEELHNELTKSLIAGNIAAKDRPSFPSKPLFGDPRSDGALRQRMDDFSEWCLKMFHFGCVQERWRELAGKDDFKKWFMEDSKVDGDIVYSTGTTQIIAKMRAKLFQEASAALGENILNELKDCFFKVDTNKSGEIGEDELTQLLIQLWKDSGNKFPENSDSHFRSIAKKTIFEVDADASGEISFHEFAPLMATEPFCSMLKSDTRKELQEKMKLFSALSLDEEAIKTVQSIFSRYDTNNDGVLDKSELKNAIIDCLKSLELDVPDESERLSLIEKHINSAFDRYGGDGGIHISGFITMLNDESEPWHGLLANRIQDCIAVDIALSLDPVLAIRLKDIFRKCDTSGDGMLNSEESLQLFQKLFRYHIRQQLSAADQGKIKDQLKSLRKSLGGDKVRVRLGQLLEICRQEPCKSKLSIKFAY